MREKAFTMQNLLFYHTVTQIHLTREGKSFCEAKPHIHNSLSHKFEGKASAKQNLIYTNRW